MKTDYAVSSVIGSVRQENQDNYFLNGKIRALERKNSRESGSSEENSQCFAVCDGMGGEDAGEIAALFAVEGLQEIPGDERFQGWCDYLQRANERICRYQERNQIRMGTTFAGVFLEGDRVRAVNVGDSRIYRVAGGQITQLSVDDTEYRLLAESGRLTEKNEPRSHNRLTQFLGLPPGQRMLDPHVLQLSDIESVERILLCSDGLYGAVSDAQIKTILASERNLRSACDRLVESALDQGSQDNITVLLIHVLET